MCWTQLQIYESVEILVQKVFERDLSRDDIFKKLKSSALSRFCAIKFRPSRKFCWLPLFDFVIRHYFTITMENFMLNRIFVNGLFINEPSIPFRLEKPRNHFSFEQVDTHHFQHWLQVFTKFINESSER